MSIPFDDERRSLAAGAIHHHEIDLEAGWLFHATAFQEGIDVKVRLRRPDGSVHAEVDSPNGDRGPEELLAVIDVSGRYRIEVVGPAKDTDGTYRFTLRPGRPATADDHALVAADHAYHEGRRRSKAGDGIGAIAALQGSLAFWQAREMPEREAATLEALGIVYQDRKDLPLAVGLVKRAAALFGAVGDLRREAVARDRVGLLHLRLGQTARAIAELEEAVSLYERAAYPRGQALALTRLATAFRQRGDIRLALDASNRALAFVGEDASRSRANILVDSAALLLRLSQSSAARWRYEEALALYQEVEDLRGAAVALNGLASAAINAEEASRGLEVAQQAISIFQEIDDPHQAAAFVSLGRLHHMAGSTDDARQAYQAAIELSESDRTSAAAHLGLGYLHYTGGSPEEALSHLEQSLTFYDQVGDVLGAASAQARCAEALLELGRLAEAEARIETAIEAVEAVRGETDRRDHRIDYFASRQRYFGIAIDIALSNHEAEPEAGHDRLAFALHERRLARALRDALGRNAGSERAQTPEPTEEERALEHRLGLLAAGNAGDPGTTAEDTQLAIRETLERLHVLWASRGVTAAPIEPQSFEVETIQGLLDADTLLIAFALGEKESVAWAMTDTEFRVLRLGPRSPIDRTARGFSRHITSTQPEARADTRELGRQLATLVLEPGADLFGDRRLVIVPDGALHTVPFGALPEPGGDGFLVESHEIAVLPSASMLAELRRFEATQGASAEAVAAFADPVFSREDVRLGNGGSAEQDDPPPEDDAARGELARLGDALRFDPYARLENSLAEAESVLSHVDPDHRRLISGFEANRDTLFDLEPDEYRILHFATHAVAHPEHGELSGLILSQLDQRGRARDGFVRAYEIARMRLPLELVNLSGCRTAIGAEVAGEGMLGLARAFLTAGAARVIASHWNVSDRHTAALMTHFYEEYLGRGESPAAALRSAQLELLADPESAELYAWAGFTLYGDWRRPWVEGAWAEELERMHAEDAGDRRRRGRSQEPPIEENEVPDEPTDDGPYLDLPEDPDDPDDPPPNGGGSGARQREIWDRLAAARRHIEGRDDARAQGPSGPSNDPATRRTSGFDRSITPDDLGSWLEERLLAGDLQGLGLHATHSGVGKSYDPRELDRDSGHRLGLGVVENVSRIPLEGRELPRDVDAHDLAQSGWGLIYPRGHRDRVENRLGALISRRREQAKDRFKLLPYDGESAASFLADRGETTGVIRPEKVPYYLMVVGKPDEIPFDFRYQLNVNHAVGHLSFEDPADNHRYAEAVVRAETGSVPVSPTVGIFSVENEGDVATELLTRHLAEPLDRNLRGYMPGYAVQRWHREQASKDRLRRIFGGEGPPGLVLASCHGKRVDPGHPDQRAIQGALMCQRDPDQSDRRFAAADISPDADLCGQISFLFSCFGAGTPLLDNFPQRPRQRTQRPGRPAVLTDRPFVAQLPQALLARGALAVIGHVDRGWTLSFAWSLVDAEITAVWSLEDAVKRLIVGDRVGHAMRPMYRRYTALAVRLGRLFNRRRIGVPIDRAALGEAWTAYHDARNFIILGDPAVYLRGRPASRDLIRLDRGLGQRLSAHARARGEDVVAWARRALLERLDAEQEPR